jgi:hypothetical protein
VQKPLRKSTCKKSSLSTSYSPLGGIIWNFTRLVLAPQVEQLNPQRLGNRLHECTPLTAGVVQDEGDWKARVCARQQEQQLTDGLRRNIREIRDGQDLVRDSIQRGQHI